MQTYVETDEFIRILTPKHRRAEYPSTEHNYCIITVKNTADIYTLNVTKKKRVDFLKH